MNYIYITFSSVLIIYFHFSLSSNTISLLRRYYNESSRWWLLDEHIEAAVRHLERQLVDGHSLLSRSNALVHFASAHLVELADRDSTESDSAIGASANSTAREVVHTLRSMAPERRRALLERFVAGQLLAQEARALYAQVADSQRGSLRSATANDYILPAHIRNFLLHQETRRPELLLTIAKALRLAREACAGAFRNELWNCPSAELEQMSSGLLVRWYGELNSARSLAGEWLVRSQAGGNLQFRSQHPAIKFGQLLRHGVKESAVWIAMMSAALVHQVAHACRTSALDCTCAPFQLLRIFLRREPDVLRMSFANRTARDRWTHMALSDTYYREPHARHECDRPEYMFAWDWDRCHNSHNVHAAEEVAAELLSGALLTDREQSLLQWLRQFQRGPLSRSVRVRGLGDGTILPGYHLAEETRKRLQESVRVRSQSTFINHNIRVGFRAVERTISRSNCIGFSGSCTKLIERPETQTLNKNNSTKGQTMRADHLLSLNISRPLRLVHLAERIPGQREELHCTTLADGSLPVRGRRHCTPARLLSDSRVVRHQTPDGVELLEYRPMDIMNDMPMRHEAGARLRPRASQFGLSSHTIAVRHRYLCQVACCGTLRSLGREMVAVSVAGESILYQNNTIEVRRAVRNYTSFFCELSD